MPWKPKIQLPRSLKREIISRASPGQPFSSPCSGFRNTGSHLPPRGLIHLFVDPAGALTGSINPMSKRDWEASWLFSSSDTWPQFQTTLDTDSRICRQTAQAFAGARVDNEVGAQEPDLGSCKLAPSDCRPSGQAIPFFF